MTAINQKLYILVIFHVLLCVKSETIKSNGRGYFPFEEDKKLEYQIYQYPVKSDYSEDGTNSILPFLEKGLNLFLLKLGVFGIIKAVMALTFFSFLTKLPLLLLKVAFIKSFFLPFLVSPLLIHFFTNQMNQSSETDEKPEGSLEDMMGMNDMNVGNGKQLTDNLTSMAWQSVKMFAESDQCVERISCIIGASNSDSSVGMTFARMLKFLHYSSSPDLQKRMKSIREAFDKGSKTSSCSAEDYKCQSPELLIQHGSNKLKIF